MERLWKIVKFSELIAPHPALWLWPAVQDGGGGYQLLKVWCWELLLHAALTKQDITRKTGSQKWQGVTLPCLVKQWNRKMTVGCPRRWTERDHPLAFSASPMPGPVRDSQMFSFHETKWLRGTNAIQKVLGSIGTHEAMAVGTDLWIVFLRASVVNSQWF